MKDKIMDLIMIVTTFSIIVMFFLYAAVMNEQKRYLMTCEEDGTIYILNGSDKYKCYNEDGEEYRFNYFTERVETIKRE